MGKSVIEVGSCDVNGSLRPFLESLQPDSYLGVDIQMGPGVDQICDAYKLLDRFGYKRFDVLIATELLEHVRDWRKAIMNFKHILKPDSIVLITTRSKGFDVHDFPFDFWRYELLDMQVIFSDFHIEVIDTDPLKPGVFIKARKPKYFIENDLTNYRLYSIVKGKRTKKTINEIDMCLFKIRRFFWLILPKFIKHYIKEKRLLSKFEDFC